TGRRNLVVNPVPSASITASSPICVGGTLTVTAVTNGVGSPTYAWTGPAPIGGSTSPAPTASSLTTANSGTYTLAVTNNGCTSTIASQVITVNPNPTITSTTALPTIVCPGSNSVLNVVATMPPPGTYC